MDPRPQADVQPGGPDRTPSRREALATFERRATIMASPDEADHQAILAVLTGRQPPG